MKPKAAGTVAFGSTLLLVLALLAAGCRPGSKNPSPVTGTAKRSEQPATVTLTMGSWRTEDVLQMNRILARFSEKHPDITVKYDPTSAPQYDAALRAQFEGGTAPDLVYLRSHAISRSLFEQGYLEPLDDLPGLTERFAADMLAPWTTDDGRPYGVPFIATSHGIYYNLDLFNRLHHGRACLHEPGPQLHRGARR